MTNSTTTAVKQANRGHGPVWRVNIRNDQRTHNGYATFVVIHGSWHDGSAWKGVARRLEELGHVAHAPTTAGHGKGVDKNATHSDAVKSVVDFVIERDLNDFVLVGHSSGGMTRR